jgi:hypothetical protein
VAAFVEHREMEGRYSYRILRYVHDIGTGEFVNVGVVFASCDAPCVKARFTTDCRRVKGAFPSLDADVFFARMERLQARFDAIDAAWCSQVRSREGVSIEALIRSVLPLEDSALHWSPTISGIDGSLAAMLQVLYERFVTRHNFRRR